MKRLLLLAALAPCAAAQWSSDPATNLPVADGPSDQAQPKLAPTGDGGAYVAWLDGIASGYDVRLQRLDGGGFEQWAHGGVLVADRGYSSTQDYGLDLHASGDALVAFRDDRTGTTQITVQRVSAAGALLWGGGFGVQLTSTSAFLASPKVCGVASGEVVVAWTENGVARVQRLDASGAPVWPAPLDLTPPAGSYTASDLHDSGDDAILSIVHQTGAQIFSAKHLLAQKLDPSGAFLWGTSPLAVFDGGSLQIGNFPPFVPDGLGGAVFSWYGVSPLQCYAQRVLASGAEAFPHNGVAGSTDLANVRVSPAACFDPGSGATTMFWKEQNAGQSLSGLRGQRYDAAGNRLWGPTGAELVPVGAVQVDQVRALPTPGGAFALWVASAGFGQDVGRGAVVDPNGGFGVGPVEFASTPSGKMRLFAALGAGGDALLAWSDDRVDAGDVLAQNLRPDGTLGGQPAWTAYCFGVGCPCGNDDPAAGCANRSGAGAALAGVGGATIGADGFALLVTNAVPGQPGLFFQGDAALAGAPFGDGLRCAGANVLRLVTLVPDGNGCAASDGSCGTVSGGTPGPISAHPGNGGLMPGDTKRYQYWYRDPNLGPCGAGFNLTNGLELTWS